MKRNEESLYIKAKKKICLSIIAIVTLLLLIPQKVKNPVEGCGANSYNHETFWHPWGNHHHKGIDIFAKKGTPIHHATSLGIVIAVTHEGDFGKKNLGGNTVSVLGTHGRVYYYAHMQEVKTHVGAIVTNSSILGTVGDSGNAKGKSPHCHFSILTVFPRFEHWVPTDKYTKRDDAVKMFYVNPVRALKGKQLW